MKDEERQLFKIILCLVGFGVVMLALMVLAPLAVSGGNAATFIFVDVAVLYLVVASSLFFGDRLARLTGGRIVAMGIYWYAIGAYALVTAVMVFLAATLMRPPLKLMVVVQLLGLFGVAAASFFGDTAGGHVEAVERAEAAGRMGVDYLRDTSLALALSCSRLDPANGPAFAELVRASERLADDLRHMAPLQKTAAFELEHSISRNLDTLCETVRTTDLGKREAQDACLLMRDTQLLVDQRKAMRG